MIPDAAAILSPVIFLTDTVIISVTAWLMVSADRHAGRGGFLEAFLAWAWSFVALITGAGVILGITGGFGALGFLALHSAMLAILALIRRRTLAADLASLQLAGRQLRAFLNTPGVERLLALGLIAMLTALTLIAAFAESAVVDALTYHLPRVGHWLQAGEIGIIPGPDTRLNFVAVLPDIVMAWLVGSSREGFPLLVLTQAIGGIMAVGATIGLARQSGLSRSASLLAGGLLLGMGNVVAQFTAAQTDLFTAGVFAVSFYLWLAALRRGEASVLGALGAGLALGAKGTLFYLAPGAVIWVAWLAWQHPLPWPQWRRTLLAAALGIGLFSAPGFVRNWRAYGDALGPAVWVKKHHQGFDSLSGQAQKITWNLTSALAQNLEPQSQPLGLRSLSQATGLALVTTLPAHKQDPYTLNHIDRRLELEKILRRVEPDADATSFGLIALGFFSVGTLIALVRWRRPSSRLVVVWSAGVVTFVVFFLTMQQWHPFAFRYFVIVAPWIALVAAWGSEQFGPRTRAVIWTLVIAGTLSVGWHVTMHTHQSGWRTITAPTRSLGYFVSNGWREWSRELDRPETPFTLDLAEERPLSAFYRQWPRREVTYLPESAHRAATAEETVRGLSGWVIVPATRFLGREGNVAASVWLLSGDEANPFSVAAYRTLAPGEKPRPIIYRQRRMISGSALIFDLLVKTVSGPAVRVALSNPATHARTFRWSTPLAQKQGTLASGERLVLELPLPTDAVGEVKIIFALSAGELLSVDSPTLEIVR